MHHTNEFSKRATSYDKHNIIQKKVVKKLLKDIKTKPKKVLDLGCGDGGVYNLITWELEKFVGVDKAPNMCKLHPRGKNIQLQTEDFESLEFENFEMVISSSALQWAKDLDTLFKNISSHTNEIAFAIFCDGTFKTIYEQAHLKTFLPNKQELVTLLEKYFICTHEVVKYKLHFEDNLSKFRYIKKSGVSGGERKLGFKQTKELIKNYPLEHLEFEVLFVWGKVR